VELTATHCDKYSEVLLWALNTARSGRFKKNDIVLIRFDRAALKLAEILQAKLLERGIHVIPRMMLTPAMEHNFFKIANTRQLIFQPPGDEELMKHLNGSIFLHAPDSLTHLKQIDPQKIGRTLVARKPLREILEQREEQGVFGWTLCTYPTLELARQANLSPERYARQIITACYLDKKDPVAEWKNIFKQAAVIKKWLNSLDVSYYYVQSENMALKITPGRNRKWIGVSGHNIPSFEIFLSPDWRGTEGLYYANQPSFRSGNYVEDVRLTFQKGKVIKVSAQMGEKFITSQLVMDRGADKVGEFSLTDKRFSRINTYMADTLFDENYGGRHGNCHIALGASYSDTFDGNPAYLTKQKKKELGFNDSALHWDLVNTEKKIVTAHLKSGKELIIYRNGMFAY